MWYDTGMIDSQQVQTQYPQRFSKLMNQLKQQIFVQWHNPYIAAVAEDRQCLRAMEAIHLVIFDDTRNMVRLSQACDQYVLPCFHEQIYQKNKLRDMHFHRRTTTRERDNFELGLIELYGSHMIASEVTSSFWSNFDDELPGHGMSVTTSASDILSIADVDMGTGANEKIRFVYHPWVTVKEIQRGRKYVPSVNNLKVRI